MFERPRGSNRLMIGGSVLAVLAAVFLHESLSGRGLVGAGLLLAAIVALYLRPPEPEVATPL